MSLNRGFSMRAYRMLRLVVTSVTGSPCHLVVEFMMGRRVMKRTIIAVMLLLLWLALLGGSNSGAAYAQTTEANAQNVQAAAPNTGAIPGRLSTEEMKAILAAADEDNHRAFSDLVQQTSALPSAVLSIYQGVHREY